MADEINLIITLNRPQYPVLAADQIAYVYVEAQPTAVALQSGVGHSPLNLALVLDRSGSMAGQKITDLKEAAKWAVEQLNDCDQVSIVVFDDRAEVIVPSQPAVNKTAVLAQLGSAIEVTAVTLSHSTATPGEMITVAITWQVTAMPGQDLTTFIHLGDPKQTPLAQADGIPRNGAYPTRYWAAGEQFSDSYTLLLPAALAPGQYPIQFGLYDSQSGARLPLFIDGARQPQDAYRVGSLTIIR